MPLSEQINAFALQVRESFGLLNKGRTRGSKLKEKWKSTISKSRES